jgi:hypothetical protein
MNLLRRDLGIAREVELLQRLHARQMSFADTPLDQPLFALLEFGLQQRFEIAEMRPPFTHRPFSQLGALRRDGWHPQQLALLSDGGRFQRDALRVHCATAAPIKPS